MAFLMVRQDFLLGSSQGGMVSAMTAADHEEEIAGAGHGFSGEDKQQAITWMAEYFLFHVNEQKG